MKITDVPVMDRREMTPALTSAPGEWTPPRVLTKIKGARVALLDGPDVEWRLAAQAARLTSNRYSGQASNDNIDWPLAKLLKTEGLDYHMRLAERYRDLHEAATATTELRGGEPNDLYMLEDVDKNGKSHGAKKITGKKATPESAATRKVLPLDGMKKLSAPVPKKWNGDWPLLARIDATRELAIVRGQLAFVPKILDAFEWAVIDGLSLADIGKRLAPAARAARAKRAPGSSTGSTS